MKLYFAPMNLLSNYVYRNILLNTSADFVFSELIMIAKFDEEIEKGKLKLFPKDISKTIFQIGAGSKQEIIGGVKKLKNLILNIKEINLNMGCPQSTMQKRKICGGILQDKTLIKELSETLSKECLPNTIPSVKLRLGSNPDNIEINEYLKILQDSNIFKVYIHARPNKYGYQKPAIYKYFQNLKNEFPNIEIIINGDIDSYNKYLELTSKISCDGIMIGRAALSNPFIFYQIKNKISSNSNNFNPVHNDINIIKSNNNYYLTNLKKEKILEFIDLAVKENLNFNLIKNNLIHLVKGLSDKNNFLYKLNTLKSINDIKELFNTSIKSE